jgi:hypothetical protein
MAPYYRPSCFFPGCALSATLSLRADMILHLMHAISIHLIAASHTNRTRPMIFRHYNRGVKH